MNDLQRVLFELLKIFIKICEKYKLKYYLVCGSALGAIKYSGFIPWDDDIDVALPRSDYDKFCSVAKRELPENIFLQNFQTDPEFPHVFSKLRNSNTTFIEKGTSHLNINHGIYIDVFPLDGYPIKYFQKKVFEINKKILTWKQCCSMKGKTKIRVLIRNKFFRLLGYHKRTYQTLLKLERLYKSQSLDDSEFWCNYDNYQGKLEYAPKWHYGNGVAAKFEGLQVIVPEFYDEYLTQKYGEWRSEPPIDKQRSHHFVKIVDTNKSYEYYQNQNKN